MTRVHRVKRRRTLGLDDVNVDMLVPADQSVRNALVRVDDARMALGAVLSSLEY